MHHTASPVAQGRAAWLALGGTGGPAAGPLTTGSGRRSFPSTPSLPGHKHLATAAPCRACSEPPRRPRALELSHLGGAMTQDVPD